MDNNTKKSTGIINQLKEEVFHSICTGQVVINLSGACRELIDNAIDAGATTLEIKLKESGTLALEVNDNGTGIIETNFSALCKAHSTSKLTSIKDFNQLSTFGFRGEALNALANLGDVTIITKHSSAKLGTRLKFDNKGEIVDQSVVPRQAGTTVIVENLFKALPVRRQEFVRNSRKEFLKLLNVIHTFALSRCDIRFICSNTINGRLVPIITTPGGTAKILNVISSLFGTRAEKGNILSIEESTPDGEIKSLYGVQNSNENIYDNIKISGYVSSCEVGHGRHSNDRQFVYVNKRPIDYSKVCKIANKVYQQFNRGQYCMLILFIEVDPASLDVNVSPDKRTVFLHAEKDMFAKLHSSLLKTFSRVLGSCNEPAKDLTDNKDTNLYKTRFELKETLNTPPTNSHPSESLVHSRKKKMAQTMDENITQNKRGRQENDLPQTSKEANVLTLENFAFKPIEIATTASQVEEGLQLNEPKSENISPVFDIRRMKIVVNNATTDENSQQVATDSDFFIEKEFRAIEQELGMSPTCSKSISAKEYGDNIVEYEDNIVESNSKDLRAQQDLFVDFRKLRKSFQNRSNLKEEALYKEEKLKIERSADVLDENQPEEIAEEHLRLMLKKSDFMEMNILGQFNNAFIFARLNDEIFMLDQHACDEKYNFEQFVKRARVQNQKLICPIKLQLGALHEMTLRENIEIFQYNGFDFSFNDDAEMGQRIQLISVPVLHGWQFDRNDIDEILGVLMEFPGVMYRPVKLKKLFASRACRKSVMFGDRLTHHQMEKIVRNLGELDQPWVCITIL